MSLSETEVYIISWPRPNVEQNAAHIAGVLAGQSRQVNVIYSTADESSRSGPGNWIQVSDAKYYGLKFKEILQHSSGRRFLQIHADALHDDWPGILKRFDDHCDANRFAGVWAPDVNHTVWETPEVMIAKSNDAMAFVAQTDCTVWGLTQQVITRLKQFNYAENNFGWGIDWAAISYCYVNNLTVVRDLSSVVVHPRGSSYPNHQAGMQQNAFLRQLTAQEKLAYRLLTTFVDHKKADHKNQMARGVR